MKVLVISHQHHLLPFSWRLQQEGWETEIVVVKDRFEKAWRGKLSSTLRSGDKRAYENREALRQQANEEGYPVITDSPKWLEIFDGYENLYGFVPRPDGANRLPPLTLGAWFDGESYSGRHLLLEDQGLWPGGLGPNVPGGLTLITPREWPEDFEVALSRVRDELKARSYRGLVKVGLSINPEDPDGDPILVGYQAGWNFLQTHAFLAEAGDHGTPTLTQILQGAPPSLHHRYTVAIPVSIPPYPSEGKADSVPIPPGAVKCGHVYWHDMLFEDGIMQTAGLDGMVGVVRASANNLLLAKSKALSFARLIALPQIQVRVDVGNSVDWWLGWLEEKGVAI